MEAMDMHKKITILTILAVTFFCLNAYAEESVWGETDNIWQTADFGGDAHVDIADLALLSANWSAAGPGGLDLSGSAVPAPPALLSGLALLLTAAPRRQRR